MAMRSRRIAVSVGHQHGGKLSGSSGGGDIPAGVTFQQIDGGPTYYADNGFTFATASVTYKLSNIGGSDITYAGWDDPKYFPIGQWLGHIGDQTDANRWLDLGLNVMSAQQSSTDLNVLVTNGIQCIAVSGELYLAEDGSTGTIALNGGSLGTSVVGLLTFDEPFSYSQGFSGPIDTKGSASFTGAIYGRLSNPLGNNPFLTSNGSNVVTVTDVGVGNPGNKLVKFSGVSVFNNVNMNGTFTFTSVDADHYTVVAGTNANAPGSGGGAACVAAYNDSSVLRDITGLTGEIYPQSTSILSGTGVTANSWIAAYGDVPSFNGVAGIYFVRPFNQLVYPATAMSVTAPTPIANSVQDNRFWWTNLTYQRVVFGTMPQFPSGDILTSDALLTLVATPTGGNRHVDLTGYDFYFLQNSKAVPPQQVHGMSFVYNQSPDMSVDQCQRGSHYGDQIDQMRRIQTPNQAAWLTVSGQSNPMVRAGVTTYPGPLAAFIENGGPNGESTTDASLINPYEMNWAIWASIIHGSRFVTYFNHTNGGSHSTSDNFASAYFSTLPSASFTAGISGTTMTAGAPSSSGTICNGMTISSGAAAGTVILFQLSGSSGDAGTYAVYPSQSVTAGTSMAAAQTISIYNQAKATNNLIRTLAPVINSKFAVGSPGYIVSVSPLGYSFQLGLTISVADGIDVCAKYYTGSSYTTSGYLVTGDTISAGFYIFACTRNSEQSTQISATFTINDPLAKSVTVINEPSRPGGQTINFTSGQGTSSAVFTDTFAFAWTIHIYRVNH